MGKAVLREQLLDRVERRVDSGTARRLMREAADYIYDLEFALDRITVQARDVLGTAAKEAGDE